MIGLNCKDVVTHRCTLCFPNGETVSALIRSNDPNQQCPVVYAGAVKRLPFRFEVADALLLKVMFRSFARELGARFEEEVTGMEALEDEMATSETTFDRLDREHFDPSESALAACG